MQPRICLCLTWKPMRTFSKNAEQLFFPEQVYLWGALTPFMLGPHDLAFVSGLVFLQKTLWILWVLWSAWFRTCLPLLSQLSPTTSHDFRLVSVPLVSTCRLVHSGCSECFGPHDFAPVSHLSPPVSRLSPSPLWMLWVLSPAWFHTCLPVVSHSCLPLHSGFSARMISHLSPTCLPVRSGWSQCSAWHDVYTGPPSPNAMGRLALSAVPPPPTTFNQPPPSTFAGSDFIDLQTNCLWSTLV